MSPTLGPPFLSGATLPSVPSSVCEALLLSYPFSCNFLTPILPASSHPALLTCVRVIGLPRLGRDLTPAYTTSRSVLATWRGVGGIPHFRYQAAETVPGWPHSRGAGHLPGSPQALPVCPPGNRAFLCPAPRGQGRVGVGRSSPDHGRLPQGCKPLRLCRDRPHTDPWSGPAASWPEQGTEH